MLFLRGTDWMIIARDGRVFRMGTSGDEWTGSARKLCVRGGRAYGNRDGFRCFRCREHVAAPVEDGARFHDEARRVDFAGDDGFGLNFDFAGRFYSAIEMAGDNDVVAVNLAFDLSVFAENQGFVRNESAVHRGIYAE